MQGINRVTLVGNLGADPELRATQGGTAILSFRLAVTESYLDKDKVRRERTDWLTCVLFGARADALAKILFKGSPLLVEGSIRTSSYDDRDGNKKYKTEIAVTNIVLLGRRGEGDGGGSTEPREAPREQGGTSRPQGGRGGDRGNRGRGGGRPEPAPPPPADDGGGYGDFGEGGGEDPPF